LLDRLGRDITDQDYPWLIVSVTDEHVRISNPVTSHFTDLGKDHIHHYTSNPDESRRTGIPHGFFTLTVQIYLQGPSLTLTPCARPGESVPLRSQRSGAGMPIPSRHVVNVNSSERNAPQLRDAIVSGLPEATNVQVVPTATINFGTGPDAIQKFQYGVSFSSPRVVERDEFASMLGSLIVDLNSYKAPGDA
jgi:hypothetical protein